MKMNDTKTKIDDSKNNSTEVLESKRKYHVGVVVLLVFLPNHFAHGSSMNFSCKIKLKKRGSHSNINVISMYICIPCEEKHTLKSQ